ncbi:hypothetical protein L580_2437 [Serratia fonticola AU-P3(3)]|nr:hypothetical protein L580_2437 [Serratia fonticola AU-P3(3)]
MRKWFPLTHNVIKIEFSQWLTFMLSATTRILLSWLSA